MHSYAVAMTYLDDSSPSVYITSGWLAWHWFCREIKHGNPITVRGIKPLEGLALQGGVVTYHPKNGIEFNMIDS